LGVGCRRFTVGVVGSAACTVVVGVAVRTIGATTRVEFPKLVGFVRLATDGVVAAFHVDDGGIFLVSGRFVGARYTCVVGVGAQAMRPAVVEARRRDVGIGSRCTGGTLSGRSAGTGVVVAI